MYLNKKEWKLVGFEKSHRSTKMYDAILENKITKKERRLPFGDNKMQNYRDITGLNLYPHLIHNDKNRRRLFRARHKGYLRDGYWSPSYFSYFFLW